jgi:diacylglycerol kinase
MQMLEALGYAATGFIIYPRNATKFDCNRCVMDIRHALVAYLKSLHRRTSMMSILVMMIVVEILTNQL